MTSHDARRMLGVGSVLMAALTACGAEPQGTQAPPVGQLATRDLPGVGTVLVDNAGRTLYFTDSDTAGAIKCTGDCVKLWIPAVAPDPSPPSADLGVVQRPEGTSQLTYQNRPLYTFTLDSKDKPASGNNAKDSFGGVDFTWHAAMLKPSAQPPPATNNDGGGGGY